MESSAHRRLTAAEGRRFAFTLAFGFAVVGGLLAWRGKQSVGTLLFAAAGVSLLAGLLAPTQLGPLARAWMAFGVALSRITSPVFFTIIYMVVVAPIGVLRRTLGRSPLARDPDAASYWIRRAPGKSDLERQF